MSIQPQTSQGSPSVERGAGSAVRSHRSYVGHVAAICRHSGRYLTRAEAGSSRLPLFRSQHEYPGLAALDREFRRAAHDRAERHFIWDIAAIEIVALVLAGLLLCVIGLYALVGYDWGGSPPLAAQVYAGISGLVGAGLVVWGLRLVPQHDETFHRRAVGLPPVLADFPLLHCTYNISAEERLQVNLGNTEAHPVPVIAHDAKVVVKLYPSSAGSKLVDLYSAYRRAYGGHITSLCFDAGVLALENLSAVQFTGLELEHRLALRAPVPPALEQGTYSEGCLAEIESRYQVNPHMLYGEGRADWRFPIECVPELTANDSYMLKLRFNARWPDAATPACVLEECRLKVPVELQPVGRVDYGRYDSAKGEVVWRNLNLRTRGDRQVVELRATFARPLLDSGLLQHHPRLEGSYRCRIDGLASGLQIRRDRVWNALGRRAADGTTAIEILRSTIVEGDLAIDLRCLLQEHEYVCSATFSYALIPDNELVMRVLKLLVGCNINVQRVERAAPRFDPAGTLNTELYYWDIVGRLYVPNLLNSIDVHIVIAGVSSIANHPPASVPATQIDLRLRSLHDPRDSSSPMNTESLRNGLVNLFTGPRLQAVLVAKS